MGFCCGIGFGPGFPPFGSGYYYQEPQFMTVAVTPNLLADAKDVYNPAFTLHGVAVPEPASASLIAICLLGFVRLRRR
jgi:hypothetical protein